MNQPLAQSGVIPAEQLKAVTGYSTDGRLKRYLDKQGIVSFPSPNGPWTTMDLVKIAGLAKMGVPLSAPPEASEKKKWL